MDIFCIETTKPHINQHSALFCDSLKDFPYQVVVLKNSNILHFKLLKRSPSGVVSWRGDTVVAQLKPAGNSCQPQYFIFQVVPASTRSSDHLEKWHSAAHLSPILVGNNGRNRSFAPTLLPALHQLAFNISCIKLFWSNQLARKHIWIMYTLHWQQDFFLKKEKLSFSFKAKPA